MAALQLLRNQAARAPLRTVDSIRAVIENDNPPPYQAYPLSLCLHSADVFANGIHADFVDEDLASVFTDFQTEFKNVSGAQRARFIFRLTIWSPRQGPPLERRNLPYQPGNIVRMTQVANLTTWKNLCQGTTELAHLHNAN